MNAPLQDGDRITIRGNTIAFPIECAATVIGESFSIKGSSLGPFILVDFDDEKTAFGLHRLGHRMIQERAVIRISDLRKMINDNLDDIEDAPETASEYSEGEKEEGERDVEIDRKIDERRGK